MKKSNSFKSWGIKSLLQLYLCIVKYLITISFFIDIGGLFPVTQTPRAQLPLASQKTVCSDESLDTPLKIYGAFVYFYLFLCIFVFYSMFLSYPFKNSLKRAVFRTFTDLANFASVIFFYVLGDLLLSFPTSSTSATLMPLHLPTFLFLTT